MNGITAKYYLLFEGSRVNLQLTIDEVKTLCNQGQLVRLYAFGNSGIIHREGLPSDPEDWYIKRVVEYNEEVAK